MTNLQAIAPVPQTQPFAVAANASTDGPTTTSGATDGSTTGSGTTKTGAEAF